MNQPQQYPQQGYQQPYPQQQYQQPVQVPVKEGFFKRMMNKIKALWEKTIFPDMIRARKEEKELQRQIKREARKQALQELQPQMIEHYKQQELDKLTGRNKQGTLQKLADGFGDVGKNIGSTDKINHMLGQQIPGQNINPAQMMGAGQGGYDSTPFGFGAGPNRINEMMGMGQPQQPQQQPRRRATKKKAVRKPARRQQPQQQYYQQPNIQQMGNFEDKIKRMLQ